MWNKVRTIIRVGQKNETQVKMGQECGTTRTRGITIIIGKTETIKIKQEVTKKKKTQVHDSVCFCVAFFVFKGGIFKSDLHI